MPKWLADLMKKLSKAILEVMVIEYGPREVVRRLSDPLWFQALNNIIGMDWDSSGSTTVTTGILKEVTWRSNLGVLVLGGKGRKARSVQDEAEKAAEHLGLPSGLAAELRRASRLTAKVDSALLQDGYQLYHHTLIVCEDGTWTVVQQGMNADLKMARRYHWLSENVNSYVVEPHTAIASSRRGSALNLIDRRVEGARKTIVDLAREPPSKTLSSIREAIAAIKGIKPLTHWLGGGRDRLLTGRIAHYKPVRVSPALVKNLKALYEASPKTLEEALSVRGVGASTLRALALVSDLIYGEPPSTRDPVTHPFDPFLYAYAFGGKDGVPYPVNRRAMEEAIHVLEEAIERARIGSVDKVKALGRLRKLVWRVKDEGS